MLDMSREECVEFIQKWTAVIIIIETISCFKRLSVNFKPLVITRKFCKSTDSREEPNIIALPTPGFRTYLSQYYTSFFHSQNLPVRIS